jgi:hypothetical protein
MANQYNDYDDDDDYDIEEESGPANLRKALKKAERESKQLRDELNSLRSESRTRTVKDVLETKGVNPKIAAFIPADADTPEKVALWLDEYSDVFGYQTSEQSDDIVAPESARRIQESTSTATGAGRDEDLASRLAATNSKEELDQLIFGMSTGR